MRLSASRIRSINRRLARAQGYTWPTRDTNLHFTPVGPSRTTAPVTRIPAVKIVALPRSAAA
ncbi:hypothetical protein DYQ86_05185 [Acidobacteria bacterium AB60]|nr:hypothetical protein DYQ86_05185 [Acidobacteria bacterium AB60]